MYAVDFTPFEKHSRFSLRPADKPTHDNQLCFVKTGNAFAHLRCSTQSIMKKVLSSPCFYTSPWSISDRSCETKNVDLYKTLDLRCRDDHDLVCWLDIQQESEFATESGYPETAFKWEPDTDIRNTFIDISRIQTFRKSCTLHNHSFIIFRSIFSAFCALTPSQSTG